MRWVLLTGTAERFSHSFKKYKQQFAVSNKCWGWTGNRLMINNFYSSITCRQEIAEWVSKQVSQSIDIIFHLHINQKVGLFFIFTRLLSLTKRVNTFLCITFKYEITIFIYLNSKMQSFFHHAKTDKFKYLKHWRYQ